MASDNSDEFQQELVDLFIQEAREWLQNIHVALDELQQGPPPERHAALIKTLTAGVTNLGGSAATINLPGVEQASYAALPLIKVIEDPGRSFSVQDFLSLCKQLGQIHVALTKSTGVSFEKDVGGESEVEPTSLATAEFLQTLKTLQQNEGVGDLAGRSLIRSMIEQMEGQIQAGVQQVGVEVIEGYLGRMSESEESFAHMVDSHVPELKAKLSRLVSVGSPPTGLLDSAIQDVTKIREEAQQVNAAPAITFFGGMQSLLSVVAQHQVRLAAEKVEAMTGRLAAIKEQIDEWVERGRAERTAIAQALPTNR